MIAIDMQIEGVRGVMAALQKLPDQAGRRILGASLKKAAEPVVQDASRRAAKVSPTIAGSITAQLRTYRKTVKVLKVGPSVGDRGAWRLKRTYHPITGKISTRFHKPEYTAHLVELGTKAHAIRLPGFKVTVRHPGTTAQPYLKPALDSNRDQVVGRFTRETWKAIQRYAKRQARKQGKR